MASNAKILGDLIAADSSIAIPGDGVILASDLADGSVTTAKLADANVTIGKIATTVPLGTKNMIINGDMRIDQRNAGASKTITSDSTYTLDRWMCEISQASKFSVQQNAASITPPTGFTNYLGVTSLSSYSVGTNDYFTVMQRIEGYNVANLDFGKATAKTVTLSFWVRSSLTGTFGGSVGNSAENRSYPFTYTISSADTWEQKSITIAGDTTGTWLVTNGRGLNVRFSLGMGSTFTDTASAWTTKANVYSTTGATSVVGTSGATFYITGVQLEVGDAATPFEHRPYDMELARCQRYCYVIGGTAYANFASGVFATTIDFQCPITYPTTMRASPSFSASGNFEVFSTSGLSASSLNIGPSESTNQVGKIGLNVSGATAGRAGTLRASNDTTARLTFTAEL